MSSLKEHHDPRVQTHTTDNVEKNHKLLRLVFSSSLLESQDTRNLEYSFFLLNNSWYIHMYQLKLKASGKDGVSSQFSGENQLLKRHSNQEEGLY